MEAGNKTSEEKTLEEKSPRGGQEDRRTAGKEGAPEKATERGQDKVRMRWREVKKRGREDNMREGKEEDRDDMEEEGRVGGERAEEFPCPVQRKWA